MFSIGEVEMMMRYLMAAMALALLLAASTDTAFAAKEKFVRSKPHVNVGTIGHVDQGKSLVTLFVRTAASVIDPPGICKFKGEVIVSVLGAQKTDRSNDGVVIRELDEYMRIPLVLENQNEVAEIPLDFQEDPNSPRQTFHLNIVSDSPKESDPCGLEVSVDEKDAQSGEGGRHTPFFSNYRPQFYFR
jgi:hypothetical protein